MIVALLRCAAGALGSLVHEAAGVVTHIMFKRRIGGYAQLMKSRRATESKKSRRSLECLATEDLKRVTGGGWPSADHGYQWELAPSDASSFQMFDML